MQGMLIEVDPLTKSHISTERIEKDTNALTSWQPINLPEACNALNFLSKSIGRSNEIIIKLILSNRPKGLWETCENFPIIVKVPLSSRGTEQKLRKITSASYLR